MSEIKLISKRCEQCNNEFIINESLASQRKKRFCCARCSSIYNGVHNKGNKMSLEARKKMTRIGEFNNFYGKKHSVESLKKISDNLKWGEDKFSYSNLSEVEQEVFDGLLISDGCLEKPSRISSRLLFCFKHKEILEKIINDLPSIIFSDIKNFNSKPHKKTNKSYSDYRMKSKKYFNFIAEYNRWYDVKKIIPEDFRLTSLSCYWWYICDGYIMGDYVILCTDCFSSNDNYRLIEMFETHDLYPKVSVRNRVYFNKRDSKKFLEWIIIHNKNIKVYNYKFKL